MIKRQFIDALVRWGAEGLERFSAARIENGLSPVLSHICFKFQSDAEYAAYVMAMQTQGTVTRVIHNGKEIVWCRLYSPVQHNALQLEWLELVEPKFEHAAISGVSSIGYAVPGLSDVVKMPSQDGAVTFRYQPHHAAELARNTA
ncbi:MAG: hypothetical protein ACXW4B_09125 [Micavibrio sp.]